MFLSNSSLSFLYTKAFPDKCYIQSPSLISPDLILTPTQSYPEFLTPIYPTPKILTPFYSYPTFPTPSSILPDFLKPKYSYPNLLKPILTFPKILTPTFFFPNLLNPILTLPKLLTTQPTPDPDFYPQCPIYTPTPSLFHINPSIAPPFSPTPLPYPPPTLLPPLFLFHSSKPLLPHPFPYPTYFPDNPNPKDDLSSHPTESYLS